MDLAASIQAVTEEVVLRLTRALAAETGMRNLCLAGGVALNCVANGKVLRDGAFERHLDPARGGRCRRRARRGARASITRTSASRACRRTARMDGMQGGYLGPALRAGRDRARGCAPPGARFDVLSDERAARSRPSTALAAGKAVGWFQGRMEFGPRALGAPLDPRRPALAQRCRRR